MDYSISTPQCVSEFEKGSDRVNKTKLKKILTETIEKHYMNNIGYLESLDDASQTIYLRGMNNGIVQTCQATLKHIKAEEMSEKNKTKKMQNKKFIKPTIEEITSYCQERENSVDAENFWDHYEARDWILNNHRKMKCWKSAVRTWEKKDFGKPKAKKEPIPEWLNNPSSSIVVKTPEDAVAAVARIKKLKESYKVR